MTLRLRLCPHISKRGNALLGVSTMEVHMDLEQRVEQLERRSRRYMGVSLVLGISLATLLLSGFAMAPKATDGVMRVKGLIVEDAQGHARILLGAPFPEDAARKRTDARSTAMVFLDEQGHDRLTVGESLPVQRGGQVEKVDQRIAPSFGVMIHDLEGNERGGLNFLSNGRAALTLDYPGRDGIGLMVDDRLDRAEFMLNYSPTVTGPGSAFELFQHGEVTTFSINDKEGDPAKVRTFRFGKEDVPSKK